MAKITQAMCRSLRHSGGASAWEDVWDDAVPGFHLRVSKRGGKRFAVRYRAYVTRRQRRDHIGEFPAITVAEAREHARRRIAEQSTARAADVTAEPMELLCVPRRVADAIRVIAATLASTDCRRVQARSNQVLLHTWEECDYTIDGSPVMICRRCGAGSTAKRIAVYKARIAARLIREYIDKERKHATPQVQREDRAGTPGTPRRGRQ